MNYLSLSKKLMLAGCGLIIITATPLLATDNENNNERSIVRGDNQTDKRVDRSSSLTDKKNSILERIKNRNATGRQLDTQLYDGTREIKKLHRGIHSALDATTDKAFQAMDRCDEVKRRLYEIVQSVKASLNTVLEKIKTEDEFHLEMTQIAEEHMEMLEKIQLRADEATNNLVRDTHDTLEALRDVNYGDFLNITYRIDELTGNLEKLGISEEFCKTN